MKSLDVRAINNSLPLIENSINKYIKVINHLHLCDVSISKDYQTAYNGFYRMRQRKQEYYQMYFYFLEKNKKNKDINFVDVLSHIHKKTGRYEPSFSSKLLATINHDTPVWDSVVLKNLSIKQPKYYQKDRLSVTIKTYRKLLEWYEIYFKTKNAIEVLTIFNLLYPHYAETITAVKKIDLALWSLSKGKDKKR